MSTTVEERLSQLEDQTRRLHDRLERVEAWVNVPAPRAAPQVAAPGPTRVRSAPPVQPMSRPEPLPEHDLEELLGGRLLALVGGLAVLVGLAFLVALAVERGWLGEEARTVLAFVGSALLLGLGAWLHEHRGRTQASLAACGTGLAGLFLSLTAATVLYDLVPVGPALAGAFVFGAAGAALAVRWDATPIGGLGILGALAAPILTGATHNAQALLFLAIAEAAAVAVLVWRRWDWLRVAAVALVLIEIAVWTFDAEPTATRAFVVLALFGVLNLAAATAFELRADANPHAASLIIVVGNAAAVGLLGAWAVANSYQGSADTGIGWWLAGLGIGHAVAALLLLRAQPHNRTIATWLFGVGLVADDIHLGDPRDRGEHVPHGATDPGERDRVARDCGCDCARRGCVRNRCSLPRSRARGRVGRRSGRPRRGRPPARPPRRRCRRARLRASRSVARAVVRGAAGLARPRRRPVLAGGDRRRCGGGGCGACLEARSRSLRSRSAPARDGGRDGGRLPCLGRGREPLPARLGRSPGGQPRGARAGPGDRERVLEPARPRSPLGRAAARPPAASPRTLLAAPRRGRQGLPLRHGGARPRVPRPLVRRAGRPAPRRRVRIPALPPPRLEQPLRDSIGRSQALLSSRCDRAPRPDCGRSERREH